MMIIWFSEAFAKIIGTIPIIAMGCQRFGGGCPVIGPSRAACGGYCCTSIFQPCLRAQWGCGWNFHPKSGPCYPSIDWTSLLEIPPFFGEMWQNLVSIAGYIISSIWENQGFWLMSIWLLFTIPSTSTSFIIFVSSHPRIPWKSHG